MAVAPIFCLCVCLFVFIAVGSYWNMYVKLGPFKSNNGSDCHLFSWPTSSHSTCHVTQKYMKECSSSFTSTLILAILRVFLHFSHF